MLDLAYVLRRTWQIFLRHRLLWVFGWLAQLGTLGLRVSAGSRERWTRAAAELAAPAGQVLLRLVASPWPALVGVVLGLGAAFGWMVLAAAAGAALIDQVRAAEEQGAVRWRAGWQAARRHLWPVLGLRVLAGLPLLLLAVGGALPVGALGVTVWASADLPAGGVISALSWFLGPLSILGCLFPALAAGLLLAIPLHILLRLAVCGRVLEGLDIGASVRHAWRSLRRHGASVLFVWMLEVAAGAVVGLALGLPLLPVAVVLSAGAGFAGAFSALAALILSAGSGLLFGLWLVVVTGLAEAFSATLWTLAYRDMGGLGLTGVEAQPGS